MVAQCPRGRAFVGSLEKLMLASKRSSYLDVLGRNHENVTENKRNGNALWPRIKLEPNQIKSPPQPYVRCYAGTPRRTYKVNSEKHALAPLETGGERHAQGVYFNLAGRSRAGSGGRVRARRRGGGPGNGEPHPSDQGKGRARPPYTWRGGGTINWKQDRGCP